MISRKVCPFIVVNSSLNYNLATSLVLGHIYLELSNLGFTGDDVFQILSRKLRNAIVVNLVDNKLSSSGI